MIRVLLASAFLVVTLATAQASEIRLPSPSLERLPNGLEVVWFENDKLPLVDVALVIRSGYRDDPSGRSGTAELVSNLLDRGAGSLTAAELAHATEALGASRYANSDEEAFTVGIHGLSLDASRLLELLGMITLQPSFSETELEKEKSKALDRWNHGADYGETLVSLAFRRQVTAGTVYGRGGFLSPAEFKKITRSDVVSFHKKHFTPKNAILLIAGRVNRAEILAKIQTVFGAWQGEAPKHEGVPFSDSAVKVPPGKILLIDRPQLGQAQIRIGFPGPSLLSPDRFALIVANALLGEYFNSRLNSLIRDKLGLTYAISSQFAFGRESGIFSISSSTQNEKTGQLVQKTLDVLKDLQAHPVSEDEIRTAKEYLIGGFPLGTATLGAVASRWLAGYVLGLGPDYLNEFVPKIQAVTLQQVQKAISQHLQKSQPFITIAGDAKEIGKSLTEQPKSIPFKKISAKELLK